MLKPLRFARQENGIQGHRNKCGRSRAPTTVLSGKVTIKYKNKSIYSQPVMRRVKSPQIMQLGSQIFLQTQTSTAPPHCTWCMFRGVRVGKSLPVESASSEINKTTLHSRTGRIRKAEKQPRWVTSLGCTFRGPAAHEHRRWKAFDVQQQQHHSTQGA